MPLSWESIWPYRSSISSIPMSNNDNFAQIPFIPDAPEYRNDSKTSNSTFSFSYKRYVTSDGGVKEV